MRVVSYNSRTENPAICSFSSQCPLLGRVYTVDCLGFRVKAYSGVMTRLNFQVK